MTAHCGPIIFDFDGTLVDSESVYAEALHQVLFEIGISVDAQSLRHRFAGIDNNSIFRQISQAHDRPIPFDAEHKLAEAVEHLMRGLEPIKGAEALLVELTRRGNPLAVASNSTAVVVAKMLRQVRLSGFFGARLVTRDQVEAPKPSPDVYILAARILASPPEECLVVEDAPTGVAAARAAGMQVIGFSPPAGCPSELLTQAGASCTISELQDLLVLSGR
jgi:HAD superfamily hydrolase (TIGR01509 family)